ncbi:hypothetical protein PoB_005976900 [Plakobranchus ocellatus]|uniref:Uncharacterized protein n=1 Tax=Plakobranchus ocellatus TaxID=259542 RepID=A0AAV4CNB0_9GAST|nr:hypothetical protein PoB_005976900 [Plakobranchus ocellatus]
MATKSCTGPEAKRPESCFTRFTSCRWTLAFLLFLLRVCQTALRQSIGMALVCMAERPGPSPQDEDLLASANNSTTRDAGQPNGIIDTSAFVDLQLNASKTLYGKPFKLPFSRIGKSDYEKLL